MTSHASRKISAPGEVFEFYMDYTKQPLSIQAQLDKLRSRGLRFDDEQLAREYLANISYYRLRAYTYPFQENKDPQADHCFKCSNIKFSDIIDLYCFDRRLRNLMFNAIEKIEVAVRARIVQAYSEVYGSHWFTERALYKAIPKEDKRGNPTTAFDLLMEDVKYEINRSNEDFIKHYQQKYDNPQLPPAWMTLEVLSLGTLSKMYNLLLKSSIKKQIALELGLPDDRILANWLHAIAVWRNCCAHHSRVWNRRGIINITLPKCPLHPFMSSKEMSQLHPNKVFTVLCCIKYISNIISPGSSLKQNILSIVGDGGNLLNLQEMGFPRDWKHLDVWK